MTTKTAETGVNDENRGSSPSHRPWWTRLGPGLITACVVIGPGSIMTSSRIGASDGYTMLWVVVISVAFMMVYMTLGAKLGAVADGTPCELIRRLAGRFLAVAVGVGVFFISAAFQSGNNIGVAAAIQAFVDNKTVVAGLVVAFNALAISFLFAFRDTYKVLERLMMGFVALMLISFAVNLISLRPSVSHMMKGLIPSAGYASRFDTYVVELPDPASDSAAVQYFGAFTKSQLMELHSRQLLTPDTIVIRVGDRKRMTADQVPGLFGTSSREERLVRSAFFRDMLPLLGLIGTTFVVTAAFYQAYLVRQKGWTVTDLSTGLLDARIGSVIMFLITVMLMSTTAAAFSERNYPPISETADFTHAITLQPPVELSNPVAIAGALETTFGRSAKVIFCLGLFSAAYSSFLVNSMIGGFMAADGLGWGSQPSDPGPRFLTTLALLTGMAVGLAVLLWDFDSTPTIIAAQAVTVIAAPLVAGVLLWLTSSRRVMGEYANGRMTTIVAAIGFALLLVMAAKTAFNDLPAKVKSYREKSVKVHVPPDDESNGPPGLRKP